MADSGPDKLSVIVFSGTYEKVHYALAMAAAALASNRAATLFFTMQAIRALSDWHALPTDDGQPAAALDHAYRQRGVAGFEELLEACVELGATIMVCEMGQRACALDDLPLRGDVPVTDGGLVSFLADATKDGAVVFV